jgi:hypothetical protein
VKYFAMSRNCSEYGYFAMLTNSKFTIFYASTETQEELDEEEEE